MGFALSFLYFSLYYMSPAFVLGPLVQYHVQLIIVILTLLVSIPALFKSSVLKTPQTLALAGLICVVFLSRFLGTYYLTGGIDSLGVFVPSAIAYFLICLHCTTKRRLQVIVIMMFAVCLIVIVNGYSDLIHDVANSGPPPGVGVGNPTEAGATASRYLTRQSNDQGLWTYRLQGLGEINDPNDFAQFQVCLLPLLFVFWRSKKTINNVAFVILPSCILLFGLYLTHSRGALVALTALLILAGRRRIGTIPSIVLASCLFLGAMALQFTGGRQISAGAGEDRTALWGEGLALFKAHPLFGVGFGQLAEYTDSHLTAHNSVVLCASELGLFGLYCWSLFLFPVFRNAKATATPGLLRDPAPESDTVQFRRPAREAEALDKEQIAHLGQLVLLSLIGFLVAGWFLSRAFVLTLFLLGGLADSVYQMGLNRGFVAPRNPFKRVLVNSAGLAIGLLTTIYLAVRALNFIH
jgi:hypothetical protein